MIVDLTMLANLPIPFDTGETLKPAKPSKPSRKSPRKVTAKRAAKRHTAKKSRG
ncbi:MAG: hypothetical protein ABI665_02985 [Vicinamibacterales bacterium]